MLLIIIIVYVYHWICRKPSKYHQLNYIIHYNDYLICYTVSLYFSFWSLLALTGAWRSQILQNVNS